MKTTPSRLSPHGVHPSIQPHQPLRAHQIPLAHQLRNVQIQRTVRFASSTQQLLHSFQRTHNPVRGRPGGFEQVEADFAGGERDVWVTAGRFEGYLRRRVGVCEGEGEVQGECAACEGEGGLDEVGLVCWREVWGLGRVGWCILLTLVGGAVWPPEDGC